MSVCSRTSGLFVTKNIVPSTGAFTSSFTPQSKGSIILASIFFVISILCAVFICKGIQSVRCGQVKSVLLLVIHVINLLFFCLQQARSFLVVAISVPLKWDELNINQIAPERGNNRVL